MKCPDCGLVQEWWCLKCNRLLSSGEGQAIAQPAEQVSPSATGCRGAHAPSNPEADSSVRCRDKAEPAARLSPEADRVERMLCLAILKVCDTYQTQKIMEAYLYWRDNPNEFDALMPRAAGAPPSGERARLDND